MPDIDAPVSGSLVLRVVEERLAEARDILVRERAAASKASRELARTIAGESAASWSAHGIGAALERQTKDGNTKRLNRDRIAALVDIIDGLEQLAVVAAYVEARRNEQTLRNNGENIAASRASAVAYGLVAEHRSLLIAEGIIPR